MKFTCNQQYLHYNKSGLIYYFHVMNNNVYMKTFRHNKLHTTVKITENIIDYSITIDHFDNFHLVSISSGGELKYSIYRDNKWDFRLLTKYDSKNYQFKNLKIFKVNGHIHILMAISNIMDSKLWILKHYYWNNQSWVNKKVCTMITEKYDMPFHVDIDSNHNIHMVFKSLYNKKYQIYYCNYQDTYNSWSMPIRISDPSYNHFRPFVLCDNIKGTHIVWSSYSHNNIKIFYLYRPQTNTSKTYLKNIQRLSNEKANGTHPYILQIGNQIKVLWKQNNEYFFKTLNIEDTVWSKSTKLQFDHTHALCPLSIVGSNYKSFINVKIRNAYGVHTNNKFFIIGIDDLEIDTKTTNLLDPYEPVYNSTKKNIEKNHLYDQMKDLMNILQDIQKKHEDMNQLLNNLSNHQKLVDAKVDKLIKYGEVLATTDHSFLEKLARFFKS